MDDEIWKSVPSEPRIEASSWGRVRRKAHISNGRAFPPGKPTYGFATKTSNNYSRMIVRYRSGIGTIKVHQAVCEAFRGPAPPDKPYVLHEDESSTNNRESNLRWGDQYENMNAPGYLENCRNRGWAFTRAKGD